MTADNPIHPVPLSAMAVFVPLLLLYFCIRYSLLITTDIARDSTHLKIGKQVDIVLSFSCYKLIIFIID